MSHPPRAGANESVDPEAPKPSGNTVIQFLRSKTGDSPRVNLRDEDSASVSAPVIDARSAEKLAVPQGRGNYQLMGEVARGGMGVVLKGHDTDLGRDIAVKVLDKRLCDRMDVVQRFVEEAQIGGQLQHPGIVPVYELGLMEDERPYFTMKLVKGRTLAALLAARETPTDDRGRLLDIFESVCQTMAYAHSRGVIHRDLKPANIMVGAFGEVQVVDWGLAKVLVRGGTADERRSREAQSHLTVLETVRSEGSGSGTQSLVGSVLGTPAYMPPEQASGQVNRLDERADVFALGAILCEILTGLPPYVGEASAVIQAASQAELEDAYGRLEACEADAVLVKLAKQCLMPAPQARPADAGVLAERVQAYVTSKEERAHRAEVEAAEAGVRAEAERKARRLTLALGAAIVAVVVVGSGGWLWVQNERAAQERTEGQRLQVAAERDRALSAEINEALNQAATLEGAERWDEALDGAERALALAQGGGATPELLATVEQRVLRIEAAVEAAASREEARLQAVRLVDDLAQIAQQTAEEDTGSQDEDYVRTFAAYGLDPDAGTIQEAATQLASIGRGPELALALDSWGDHRRRYGDGDGALRLLEIAHLVDPDPDRAHLREAMALRDVEELRYLAEGGLGRQPASTWALLATALLRLDEPDLAREGWRAGLAQHPGDFQLHFQLGRELAPGVLVPRSEAEMAEAESRLRAAIALRPESVWARHYLAETLRRSGRSELAIPEYEGALEIDPDHRLILYRMAEVLNSLGRFEEARSAFERCVTSDNAFWMQGWSMAYLAGLDVMADNRDSVRDLARAAWDSGANRSDRSLRAILLFPYYMAAARWGDDSFLDEARELFDSELSREPQSHAALSGLLMNVARPQGRPMMGALAQEGGESLLREAIEMARAGLEVDPEFVDLWGNLGRAHYLAGESEQAIAALRRELELSSERRPKSELTLALALSAQGSEAEARDWFSRGVAWLAAHPDEGLDEQLQWYRAQAAETLGFE